MKNLLSKHILRQSMRNNWKLWLALVAIACIQAAAVAGFAGREITDPAKMLFLLGNAVFEGTLMVMIIVFSLTAGNGLVVREVDRGTMCFTLNTPITRRQIILSKALFFIAAIIVLTLVVGTITNIILVAVGKDGMFGRFWLMILNFLVWAFAISGICFCSSCWFNKNAYAMTVSTAFLVLFFITKTMSNIKNFEFLQYFSLNSLFDANGIANGTISTAFAIISVVVLFAIGTVLYAVGINKFLKKDLPL